MLSRFDCDRQTDRQTDREIDILRHQSPRYAQHRAIKTSGVNAYVVYLFGRVLVRIMETSRTLCLYTLLHLYANDCIVYCLNVATYYWPTGPCPTYCNNITSTLNSSWCSCSRPSGPWTTVARWAIDKETVSRRTSHDSAENGKLGRALQCGIFVGPSVITQFRMASRFNI